VDRRGKFLLIHLDDGRVWLVHLGMSGSFRIQHAAADAAPPHPHDHLLIETDAGVRLAFHDPRRFGFMDLIAAEALHEHAMLARLGPEPLGAGFDGAHLRERFAHRAAPLKAVLLDQGTVAGMGNIYASESLFRARLSPLRAAASVSGAACGRLAAAIRWVFLEAIEAGGASLRDHRRPSGELGCFQHGFAVYRRGGKACPGCRCDVAATGGIRRIVQSGRSTYYCAWRQR
jgi:formamidopyrimidine-DNA glycosylase